MSGVIWGSFVGLALLVLVVFVLPSSSCRLVTFVVVVSSSSSSFVYLLCAHHHLDIMNNSTFVGCLTMEQLKELIQFVYEQKRDDEHTHDAEWSE